MPSTLTELKERAAELPEQDRAALALSILESLDDPADPEVEEAWRVEIARRIGQIESGEVQLIPGEEVFARLRRRLG